MGIVHLQSYLARFTRAVIVNTAFDLSGKLHLQTFFENGKTGFFLIKIGLLFQMRVPLPVFAGRVEKCVFCTYPNTFFTSSPTLLPRFSAVLIPISSFSIPSGFPLHKIPPK